MVIIYGMGKGMGLSFIKNLGLLLLQFLKDSEKLLLSILLLLSFLLVLVFLLLVCVFMPSAIFLHFPAILLELLAVG